MENGEAIDTVQVDKWKQRHNRGIFRKGRINGKEGGRKEGERQ